MAKTRRKAISSDVVKPRELWDLFHNKFPDGIVNPHIFEKCLGSKFSKDLSKVHFSFENFDYDHLEEDLGHAEGWLGCRKFWTRAPLTCFSYIGCTAGGDWEFPVKFLIYLDQDGKTFRAYIPKKGNVWNYDTKKAIGNDIDADEKFFIKWVNKNRPDLDLGEDFEFEIDEADLLSDVLKISQKLMFRFEGVNGPST